MSVYVSHQSDAVVVSARPAGQEDCLPQLEHVLENLLDLGCRVVLDLSEVTMAPASRITAFMERVSGLREAAGCTLVVVVRGTTERWVLSTLAPEPALPIVESVAEALELELI